MLPVWRLERDIILPAYCIVMHIVHNVEILYNALFCPFHMQVHKRQSKLAEEEERQRRVNEDETGSDDAQARHAVHDRMAVVEEELLHKVIFPHITSGWDPF